MTSQKENAQRQRELESAEAQFQQRVNQIVEEERARSRLEMMKKETEANTKYHKLEEQYNELYNRMEGSDIHWTEAGKAIMEKINMPSPDCRKCSQFKTCLIWREIGKSLQGAFQSEEDVPFQLHELAKVCQYYDIAKVKSEANLIQEIGR